jgi:hypothetical protein
LFKYFRIVRIYHCTQSFDELLDEGRRSCASSRFITRLVVTFTVGAVINIGIAVLEAVPSPATGDDGGSQGEGQGFHRGL